MLTILPPSKEPLPISLGLSDTQWTGSISRATEPSGRCNDSFTRSDSLQYFSSMEIEGRMRLTPWLLRSFVSPKKISDSPETFASPPRIDRLDVSSASHRTLIRCECRRSIGKVGLSKLDSLQLKVFSNHSQHSPSM